MEHYPPSEAVSNSPDEEIRPLLWIPKFLFSLRKANNWILF